MANELADALGQVFANVDESRRAQLVAWASEELGSRSVITMCTDDEGTVWNVGEVTPSNKGCTVFAMLLDSALRCVDIYSFGMVDGGGALYFKETCWRPAHTWGPIGIDALYNEWRNFFAGDGPEPGATNGAGELEEERA